MKKNLLQKWYVHQQLELTYYTNYETVRVLYIRFSLSASGW